MKKLISTSLFILFILNIYGQSFSVDSINYNTLTPTTVEVKGYITPCKSNLSIPSTVTYNAVTYNVTAIGISAFMNCTNIKSIVIPSFVSKIGNSAFSGCTSLTSVSLPASVTSIGIYSFSGCVGLNSVIIPDLVTSIGDYAFSRCAGLKNVTFSESLSSIGSNAFYGCIGLSSVTIPASVSSIGSSAFYGCNGLLSVAIPASVISIGNYAFSRCTGLINVDNANTNYSSIEGVLYNKIKSQLIQCPISKIGSFVIPSSVNTIGTNAFFECIGLTTVSIPASVTYIGNYAFNNFSGLINVDNTNPNYSSLEGVLYNKTIKKLIQCPISKAGNFVIPSTVSNISTEAFVLCTNLTSIAIPASVTSIQNSAFYRCSGSINVDNTNPNYSSFEGVLYDKNKTQLIQCPISKTGSFVIPSSVKTITDNSFSGCTGLNTITIPASVTYIGSSAFRDCVGLTSVTVNSRPIITENSTDMFYNSNNNNCVLYVPFGTKSLYKGCYWNYYFPNIVEDTQGFFLNENTVKLWASAASNAKVAIKANVVWTASSDQAWLSLSSTSGTGNKDLTLTAEANPSISIRTANVTVGASGFEPQYITITQVGLITSYAVNTPGSLASILSAEQLNSIVKLKLTGFIDARDFKTMRDNMPLLSELDLSEVLIMSYTGVEGTSGTSNQIYQGFEIPEYSFYNNSTQVGKTSLKTSVRDKKSKKGLPN